jgi:ankyrin repeat protein
LFFFPTVAHSFGKHHLQEIDQLIMQADLQTVNDWLRQGNSVNQEIQDGNRPIHFAAQKGDVQILQALLLSGAEINSVNDEGMTALHIAIQNVQS